MGFLGRVLTRVLPKSTLVPLFFTSARIKGKQEPELLYLRKILPQCRLAIDIGANNGMYAYYLSGFSQTVKAFEPQPSLCDMLRAWNHPKVEVFNMGLSDERGTLTLHVPKDESGRGLAPLASFRTLPNSIEYQVPVQRLDDFGFKNVDFIKIDVEGHETEVLRGAVETIQANQPLLLIEIEQRHLERPIGDVLSEIQALGYIGYFLKQGDLVEISTFSFETHQQPYLREAGDPRNPLEGYVNNFFFIPKP